MMFTHSVRQVWKPVAVVLTFVAEPAGTKTDAVTSKDGRNELADCRSVAQCHVVCGKTVLVSGPWREVNVLVIVLSIDTGM